ncbi:DUF6456 domain-containing protein [Allosphingosinicella indica]|uniref:DUF6456 domain-containing protein n=1 Tax=Allosphingosinicella indica TaxID=941907 RepID=A0A1X7GDV3_9SPHN|nr:DUF6456 domain-containing protein [Allosphingosinicella indica]SMF67568.1 hypothetical protein SAMN06295910_1533 [Allosphingosinicella indica]
MRRNRLLVEEALPQDGRGRTHAGKRPVRSVTVNAVESPLGWLKARGHVSQRQYDAGERLRADWEMAQLGASVTMRWDAPPLGRTPRGSHDHGSATLAQIAAKRRFDAAIEAVGPGLSDIAWRTVCAGEGMRDAESALGWPARAGKLVLGLALDRLADFYRM